MPFLSLPHELIERILISLDPASVLSCKLVNKELNFITNSSPLLQYHLACAVAGVMDNPSSDCILSYAERLEALTKREESWQKVKPVFATTIKVNHLASTIYDLTAGVYLLGDTNLRDLHYCRLPSSPEDIPKWVKIPGHGPEQKWSGFIIDMGLAIYEHDLIVNVISSEASPQNGMNMYSLNLVLLQFSTGEYHPLARHSCIRVQISPSIRPAIALEVVGDNLALVISSRRGPSSDELFIFDWKTGVKRLQHEATENAYASPVFVSPELLLIPNLFSSHFEVWFLPATLSSAPYQILSLQLPSFSDGQFLLTFSCRGEPNPFLSSLNHPPPSRPFLPSPHDGIIITNLRLATFLGLNGAGFTIVMRRRDLLDTINQLMATQSWPTSTVVRYQTNDAEVSAEGGERGGYSIHSRIAQIHHGFQAPLVTPDTFTSLSSSAPHDTTEIRYSVPIIQWSSWGSSITRWFYASDTQTRWITTSAGQRCALLDPPDLGETKTGVIIADFNPENFRKYTRRNERGRSKSKVTNWFDIGGGDEHDEGVEVTSGEKGDILEHDGLFSENIKMGLPCLVFMAPGEYEFDGLLMDEERLLGLKVGETGRVESVTVLYFG